MDQDTRDSLIDVLGREMSEISEEAYCAGWLAETEYYVPELCRRAVLLSQTQKWGHGEITPRLARGLISIAEQIGCWADYDMNTDGWRAFQPFPIPPEIIAAIEAEQKK